LPFYVKPTRIAGIYPQNVLNPSLPN